MYKIFKYVCLFLLILMIGCKKEQVSEPHKTPKGIFLQRYAFTSFESFYNPKIIIGDIYNDNGKFDIYNSKSITEGVMPSLSKDQKWLTYLPFDPIFTVWRANIDGTNNQEIEITTPGLYIQEVHISPNNNMLVVSVGSFSGLKIGTIPVNGGEYLNVFGDSLGRNQTPCWSPDSKKIYFTYTDIYNRFGHNTDICIFYIASINIDGTNFKIISDTISGISNDNEPSVSPDGANIAFNSSRNRPGFILPEIFVMDTIGNNIKQLSQALVSEKQGDHFMYFTIDMEPNWLSDNEHIVFTRQYSIWNEQIQQYTDEYDLYIVNKDGTELQNLTKNKHSAYKEQ